MSRKITKVVKSVGNAVGDAVQTVVNTVTNTVDAVLEDPVKAIPIAIAIAAPGIGTAVGTALGATGTTAAVVGNAIVGGVGAELTGGDFKEGAIQGGLGAGLASTLPATGIPTVDAAIVGGTTSGLTGGDVVQGAIIGGASGALNQALSPPSVESVMDLAPDSFPLDVPESTINTGTLGGSFVADYDLPPVSSPSSVGFQTVPTNVEVFQPDGGVDYSLYFPSTTTDFVGPIVPSMSLPETGNSFTPDYSLLPTALPVEEFTGQGLNAPKQTGNVFLPDGSVDYGFNVPDTTEGLKPVVAPSLDSMGGGQGLVAEVPGGVVTEDGFISNDKPVVIGNPESFINKEGGYNESAAAKALQEQLLGSALTGILQGMLLSSVAQNRPAPVVSAMPAYRPANTMPVYDQAYFDAVQSNYNALAPRGLLADVATPLQQWYASEPSVTERLFGGKL